VVDARRVDREKARAAACGEAGLLAVQLRLAPLRARAENAAFSMVASSCPTTTA